VASPTRSVEVRFVVPRHVHSAAGTTAVDSAAAGQGDCLDEHCDASGNRDEALPALLEPQFGA
jgi:hypothetical protein